MRAGLLDKRIAIQQKAATVDAFGEEAAGYDGAQWTTVIAGWARVQPLSGREARELHQQSAEVSHRITMRWRAGVEITPAMRVLWGVRAFDIDSITQTDEGKHEWQLMCRERVAAEVVSA